MAVRKKRYSHQQMIAVNPDAWEVISAAKHYFESIVKHKVSWSFFLVVLTFGAHLIRGFPEVRIVCPRCGLTSALAVVEQEEETKET